MRVVPLLTALALVPRSLIAQSGNPIDLALASRYFQEAQRASDDVGALWPQPLYGPLIFIDPKTHRAVANGPDKEGKLTARGDVWVGELPREIGAANTAVRWAGVHWSLVMWPVPQPIAERNLLLMHESFHRIQGEIGLPATDSPNAHLDTKEGRTWTRLEWRALSRALVSSEGERQESLTDSLLFRAYRRALFPWAAREEDRKEVHEGLAEYTGIRAMGLGDHGRRSYLAGRMRASEAKPSYTYAFAYETGPAYGLLLDTASVGWRSRVNTETSLSGSLAVAAKIELPRDLGRAAERRANLYGGREVRREEEIRHRELQAKLARYRRLLVEGPVLELPLAKPNFTFDPNEVVPLGEFGTVYPRTTLSDGWGTITAERGARLIFAPTMRLFVPAPVGSDPTKGEGWSLTLKPGWTVVPDARRGDFRLTKSES